MNRGDHIQRELQMTADGSHTLFQPEINEHYHSVNGAIQESGHVFIEAGFRQLDIPSIRVFEVGFGTGLNAFLTMIETMKREAVHVTYYAVEKYPLELDLVRQLNYGYPFPDLFLKLHEAEWEKPQQITDGFTLCKMLCDSNSCELPEDINLIYFDAFAPDKQPEMWNREIFNALYAKTAPGGVLTTYCAKGAVRRMMQEAGYTVERIPGPPGKREMLRARKRLSL